MLISYLQLLLDFTCFLSEQAGSVATQVLFLRIGTMLVFFKVSFIPDHSPLRILFNSNANFSCPNAYYAILLPFSKHKMETTMRDCCKVLLLAFSKYKMEMTTMRDRCKVPAAVQQHKKKELDEGIFVAAYSLFTSLCFFIFSSPLVRYSFLFNFRLSCMVLLHSLL